MPVSTPVEPAAPHGLDLVIDFVNTLELETSTDQLAKPRDLAAWLVERKLLDPPGAPVREVHRQQALRLREALRALMLRHNGITQDRDAGSELERVAHRGRLSVQFAVDGSASIAPRGDGIAAALARLLVPVAESAADGTWTRVKACRAGECHWAFYDQSRNRSGVWCDMAVCGNRTKVRAYRQKKPSGGARSRFTG